MIVLPIISTILLSFLTLVFLCITVMERNSENRFVFGFGLFANVSAIIAIVTIWFLFSQCA